MDNFPLFPSLPTSPNPPLQNANFIFIVVLRSMKVEDSVGRLPTSACTTREQAQFCVCLCLSARAPSRQHCTECSENILDLSLLKELDKVIQNSFSYEWRAKFITKVHADLVFRACISFFRCFRTPGTPIRKSKCTPACYPVLSLDGLNYANLYLVPILFWMLTMPWAF